MARTRIATKKQMFIGRMVINGAINITQTSRHLTISGTFVHHFEVFANKENSAIFAIPKAKTADMENIIEQYEQIFSETN